jgi:hypothetical protein
MSDTEKTPTDDELRAAAPDIMALTVKAAGAFMQSIPPSDQVVYALAMFQMSRMVSDAYLAMRGGDLEATRHVRTLCANAIDALEHLFVMSTSQSVYDGIQAEVARIFAPPVPR